MYVTSHETIICVSNLSINAGMLAKSNESISALDGGVCKSGSERKDSRASCLPARALRVSARCLFTAPLLCACLHCRKARYQRKDENVF